MTPADPVAVAAIDRLGAETSERQWRDVLGILKTEKNLDAELLREAAREVGVHDLLDRALQALRS